MNTKTDSISRKVLAFHSQLSRDVNHRYKSWEHCYSYFTRRKVDTDTACLQLAFYLASWGMYRGSSFLLWKDYQIHTEVVSHILHSKHLQSIDFSKITEEDVEEIVELVTWIKKWYQSNVRYTNGVKKSIHVTDTLASKILLGTLGCVPAFDRYFYLGLRDRGLKCASLNSKSFTSLVLFYQENEPSFSYAKDKILERTGFTYPPMKLVDMYFWQIGFELDRS